MIKFGAWSITLLLGSLHALVMAGLLVRSPANRTANRCLAALLVLVVLRITPYTIGYAGFYDAYPWLTFAPFFWQLGIGPLTYLYVRQLGEPRMPRGWGWHFVPLALQVAYYATLFVLPLETKWQWNDSVHVHRVLPLERIFTVCSLSSYLFLAGRQLIRYQRWLRDNSAASEEYRLGWVRNFLIATTAAVVICVSFGLADLLFRPLTYFDEFPLYVVLTALVYYLGLEGWRNAALPYPHMQDAGQTLVAEAGTDGSTPGRVEAERRDWAEMGAHLREQFIAGRWWLEPDLDLAELARRLGTNSNYVSRAINEGLGTSFSAFVNGERVEEAKQRLAEPGDVLAIALEVGFSSKASFNRAFKARVGCTPTEWRMRLDAARITS